MSIYYTDDKVVLHHGDCLDVLANLPDASVDAVVTDPPYGLANTDPTHVAETITRWVNGERDYLPGGSGFMGAKWDAFVPPVAVWDECLRVLKPGGHVLAFAGSRTVDLMTLGLRLAGFDIRDSLAWLYGSGFPKSMDVSKAIDKAAGAEREVVGSYEVTRDMTRNGRTGDEAISPVPVVGATLDITAPATPEAERWQGWGTALKPGHEPVVCARKPIASTVAANVLEHGTGALNIDACRIGSDIVTTHSRGESTAFPKRPGETTVEESGRVARQDVFDTRPRTGRWPANVILDESQAEALDEQSGTLTSGGRSRAAGEAVGGRWRDMEGRNDARVAASDYAMPPSSGGASRFFYVAKAPKSERPVVDGVAHSTVKPLSLMSWLVRLVTPPGGTVLEPFAGSGTTVEAAMREGFNVVAVEREADYLPLILARIDRENARQAAEATNHVPTLFDEEMGE